jgi:phage-related holin
MTARTLLVRGLLVGLGAGVVAFFVAYLFEEPSVAAAFAVQAQGQVHDPEAVEVVGRTVQSTVDLLVAMLGFGASVGGLFGLAFAFCRGRLGDLGVRTSAALIALVGFVTIYLMPFIKYPANPPAVGRPDGLSQRTGLFVVMMVLSVLAAMLAAWVAGHLGRLSGWDRTLSGVGVYLILVTICMAILPQVNEVGEGFPALTLWEFRTGAFLTQVSVWATLGLLFGAWTDRAGRVSGQRRARVRMPSAR